MTSSAAVRKYQARYRVARGQRSAPGVCERCGLRPKDGRHLCSVCRASRPAGRRGGDSVNAGVYRTAAWRRLREQVVAQARMLGEPCGICGRPIDWAAPARSKWSPSVDHRVPLTHGGAPLTLGNLRCVHTTCNSRLGAALASTSPSRAASFARLKGAR